jgi:hypothetical protein
MCGQSWMLQVWVVRCHQQPHATLSERSTKIHPTMVTARSHSPDNEQKVVVFAALLQLLIIRLTNHHAIAALSFGGVRFSPA